MAFRNLSGWNDPDFDFLGNNDSYDPWTTDRGRRGYDSRLQTEFAKFSDFDRERAQSALGLKKLDSVGELEQMRNYLGGGGGGGGAGGGDDGGGGGFDRGSGEFEDIIGSLQDDIAAANQRAQDFADQQAQGIADNTAALNAQFEERLARLTEGFNTRYGQLESVFEKQTASMMQFQQQMQGQMQQAQNSYNQQVQMMQNIQNSRVPVAEENAFTAQIGDQREDSSRDKENNRLSDLSILSGLGTSSNPTSGLSLA
jgi:hypothetical protein